MNANAAFFCSVAFRRWLAAVLLGGCGASAVAAPSTPPATYTPDTQDSAEGSLAEPAVTPLPVAPVAKKNDSDLVVAPIPRHDPSQGWGVVGIAQYIFKHKNQAATTPPSIAGLVAFYTEEHSYGVAGGYLGHWKDDLWRPVFFAGYANLHYDFYGVGNDAAEQGVALPVDQEVTFGLAQAMRRFRPHLYAGLRTLVAHTDIHTDALEHPPVMIPAQDRSLDFFAGGPIGQWDSRDSQFYPTQGDYVNLSALFYGGDREYQVYKFTWNHYHPLGENMVLACRAALRLADGDVPFYALSQFGQGTDLRGYIGGKYRDNGLVAVQAEFRQVLSPRWGYVLFAGVGEVMPSFSDFDTDNLLASGGAGIRFRLSRENPVNLRLDWAYGKDGPATYIGVNEAF